MRKTQGSSEPDMAGGRGNFCGTAPDLTKTNGRPRVDAEGETVNKQAGTMNKRALFIAEQKLTEEELQQYREGLLKASLAE